MEPRQFDAVAIPSKNPINKPEESYISLPDLYIRKYMLCDKLQQIKKHYVPKCDIHTQNNKEIHRQTQQWGLILNDVQAKAIDVQERKKWKIALAYQNARLAVEEVQQRNKDKEEVVPFNICVSHYMAQQVVRKFQNLNGISCMQVQGIEIESNSKLNQFISGMNKLNSIEIGSPPFPQEAFSKVKEYIVHSRETNSSLCQSFEFLVPDAPSPSEINNQDTQPERRDYKQQHIEFDFSRKYDNISEVLQLYVSKDQPIKQAFDKSTTYIDGFPTQLDDIPRIKLGQFNREVCIDQEYEDLLYLDRCVPEQVLCDGERTMKKIKVYQTIPIQIDSQMPQVLDIKDLFRFKYYYIERDCHFIQQNGKMVPIEQSKFTNHQQQITKQHPILQLYFIYYLQRFRGDFNQISFALQSNQITCNMYIYTPNFCQDLYAWYIHTKQIPTNTKFAFHHQYHQIKQQIQIEQIPIEQNQDKLVNIQQNYEELLNQPIQQIHRGKKYHIANELIRKQQSSFKEDINKPVYKDISNKITIDQLYQQKPSSLVADYSLVDKVSFAGLKQTLDKLLPKRQFMSDRKTKSIFEIIRADTIQIEQIRKELRKPRTQNPMPIRPQQYGYQNPPPGYKGVVPPQARQQFEMMPPQPLPEMATRSNSQVTQPQPRVEPPPQVVQPPPVQPPVTASAKKRQSAQHQQAAALAAASAVTAQAAPPTVAQSKSRRKESKKEEEQEPVRQPAPRRSKKNQKAAEAEKQGDQ